tara:strand:+ start:103 stop:372 length:270 start_codon:yes stop_codon:yes gene_type:complete
MSVLSRQTPLITEFEIVRRSDPRTDLPNSDAAGRNITRWPYSPSYIPSKYPQSKSSKCKEKIQEILFNHSSEIPEGLYIKLMDALLIED